ncbi:MAG: AMP-binding protein [Actinobacteria bacterium]|nr:AMP-binding protein [Actinomycetota bacterium]
MGSEPPPLVHEILGRAAAGDPERPWLTFTNGATHTLADLDARVDRVVAGLQAAGVAKGDRIAIMASNRIEFVATWFAAHRAGAIAVPVNVAMRGDVLAHVLDLVEPTAIVIEGQYLRRLADAIGGREYLRSVSVLDPEPDADAAWPGWAPYADLHSAETPRRVEMSPNDPSSIMYTSGTTGPSKGIVWTHGSTWHMIQIPRVQMGYGPDDVVYTCLPLFHATALIVSMLMSLAAGARIVIAPRFSVSGFWDDVIAHEATGTAFLGAMTQLLIAVEPSPLDRTHRLRTAMMVPAKEEDRAVFRERFGLEVVESYGLTDFGWLAWPRVGEPVPPGSVGRPHESFEVRLVDADDEDVPVGEAGEIVARPRRPWTTPLGYWGMPEATLESRRNLWFHTGDLLRADTEGYLYFVDRGKDAMRRRGENVSSFEVERAVAGHPAVAECAAYAISSDFSEDEVAIAVVLRDGAELEAAELIAAIEGRLPYFAVPRFVRFVPALPKTQTEKVRKDQLRAAGLTDDTWDREASGYQVSR